MRNNVIVESGAELDMRKRIVVLVSILILVVVTLPYLLAWTRGLSQYTFGGFLMNPIDGNSYLAKMYQGWRGDWTFKLPFSAEPGEGTYLFLFYLLLGQAARWTSLSLRVVFHLARTASFIFLLVSLWIFYRRTLEQEKTASYAWLLAIFGSGMGWLTALLANTFTADLWVAEAYPFLAGYSNPHFPLAMGLMLWIFMKLESQRWQDFVLVVMMSALLAVILPFANIIVLLMAAGMLLTNWQKGSRIPWMNLLALALGSMPVMIYQLVITYTHPALRVWNAQNSTPTPPLWDIIISFSPVLLFSVWEIWRMVRARQFHPLVVWVVLVLVLVYLPLNLQRRFLFGLYIPLAGLAAIQIDHFLLRRPHNQKWIKPFILGISSCTNLLVLLAGFLGTTNLPQEIYLSQPEVQAFEWIQTNTSASALILTGPETGLFIPAWTGRRVIYGHAYETIEAEKRKEEVESFFEGSMSFMEMQAFIRKWQVNYIYMGPRESPKEEVLLFMDELKLVYDNSQVKIYALP